jgi:predicted alpha/beta hydrolase family esterase
MTPVLIVPGIGGSGSDHWQSRWEAAEPKYRRVQMPDWDRPELGVWLEKLAEAVRAAPEPPVIVAHSLGCLAVAHFAARGGAARAAMLVALPDCRGKAFPEAARSFAAAPLEPIPFPTRVVASRNDPYASFEYAESCAKAWGSAFSDAGRVGHINAESGLGDWAFGRRLLADLLV